MSDRSEITTTDRYVKCMFSYKDQYIITHVEYLNTGCITCVRIFDLREFLDELGISLSDCQKAFEQNPNR